MKPQTTDSIHPKIIDINHEITDQISAEDAEQFKGLSTNLFRYISQDELNNYKKDDLKGLLVTLYRYIKNKPKQEATIFNPNIEEHGWQSPHTALILHHTDTRYLIDSIKNILNTKQIKIHKVFHSYLLIERDKSEQLVSITGQNGSPDDSHNKELLLYIEIDHHSRNTDIKDLNKTIDQTIRDVEVVAEDYKAMSKRLEDIASSLQGGAQVNKATVQESKTFCHWMKDGHFTFLAYDEYTLDKEGIKSIEGSGLGLFRQHNQPKTLLFENMTNDQIQVAKRDEVVVFSKSGHLSSVHRPAYSDYVVIKQFNDKGEVIGGHRFMGLYKHNVYINSANDIPIIREKIKAILEKSEIPPNTYNYAELSHILETFPRDELFQADIEYLLDVSLNILYIQERRKVKLFLREDVDGKFVSAIFYAPRDRLNSRLREQVYELLAKYIDIESHTASTWFSESFLARCRFVFRLKQPLTSSLDQPLLEKKVVDLAKDWNEELQSSLNDAFGEEKSVLLYKQYHNAFPPSYIDEHKPGVAVYDIERMQKLSQKDGCNLSMSFYRSTGPDYNELKIKIYHKGNQLSLSDMVPVLENFGLKVIEELPYDIEKQEEPFWIYNFTVDFPFDPDINPSEYRDELSSAFIAVWTQKAENDDFNQLVLKAGLNWRQITVLRAYSRYMKQISFGFSQKYIANSLINHTDIAKKLIAYFNCCFSSDKKRSEKTAQRLVDQLEGLFENVASLSEDRILRQFLELMQSTLRTNFFQKLANGEEKEYLSLKLNPNNIKEIPLPRPKYEIFVYSPRVEGVHLRGGKVARGGLRWSDRTEDFRTEILGLVKAQQVKNAVIVPVGAKGGFIAKRLPPANDREAFWKEGIACYRLFIRGLLDITDNIKEGDIISPIDTVKYDDDDPYLVVAADKGTATFSDIANEISLEYKHWLGDAFASGGSNGYDHKKMGITARGAWVSVQRHFREMNINVQTQSFSVVGIGDMSGDVFGNGMLLSNKIKLVGAFNHLHIFIDPNPNTEVSFAERQRLFNLSRSSWQDYDKTLISKGGGIFSRAAKSISLTSEIQTLLNTKTSIVTPTELISMMLKSNVDMLWNGGIGTYVKASNEQNSEVGDKSNDALRINADELNCKVIGEGGNLGLTQKARIEFGLLGGAIFTDFIDNAAGVDCSDHEVNIKILLDKQVNDGELTEKQRNRHLETMTEDVADLVLKNNYRQTQSIALDYSEAAKRIEEYRHVIMYLESAGKLDRALEFIPSDEALLERKKQEQGLTQAELSILISYVKADMKEALANTDLGDDHYLASYAETAFPAPLVEHFKDAIAIHPLKKEIIATQIANDMFNYMGIAYVNRMQQSTGASHSDIAKAFVAAKNIFALDTIWTTIEALDYKLDSRLQYQMMLSVSRLIRRASRWLIKNHRAQLDVSMLIELYAKPIQGLGRKLSSLLPEPLHQEWQQAKDELASMGAPDSLANTIASCEYLYDFLSIIAASNSLNKNIDIVASAFFTLAEKLDLDDFSNHLESKMPTTTHWQAMARESLRDDLESQQRQLTQNMLSCMESGESDLQTLTDEWLAQQSLLASRWKNIVVELNNHNDGDTSILSIAIRELSDLSQATRPSINT